MTVGEIKVGILQTSFRLTWGMLPGDITASGIVKGERNERISHCRRQVMVLSVVTKVRILVIRVGVLAMSAVVVMSIVEIVGVAKDLLSGSRATVNVRDKSV